MKRGDLGPQGTAIRQQALPERMTESEAMYQVMMLARVSRQTNWRVFTLREHELPWSEILRRLTAEGDGADAACD